MASSELENMLRARGASFGSWIGLSLPMGFGEPQQEWLAAREGCGVFVATFRTLIRVDGEDRIAFLQGMLSNDVASLAAGKGIPAVHLSDSGKVVSDLRLYADTDRLFMDVVAWRAAALCASLDRYLVADDVETATIAEEQPLLGLIGPNAASVFERVLGQVCRPTQPLEHETVDFSGYSLRVVRASEAGVEGLLLCGPQETGRALFESFIGAGAVPLGMEALNVLRVEAGVPWAGIDMDERVLVMEVGLDDAISFSKGCYLGQEVVERVAARGHVNRRLVGLSLDSVEPPHPGASVRADGHDVGHITSAVRSLAVDRAIALGYIHRTYVAPGSRVEVATDAGGYVTARVQQLPFANIIQEK